MSRLILSRMALHRMVSSSQWILAALALAALALAAPALADRPDPRRWQEEIEAMPAPQTLAQGETVFVGSSSIRLWDIAQSFPDRVIHNRGFGGSHLADTLHYAKWLVSDLKPKTIVMYAGDNDIAHGLTPDEVKDDFIACVEKFHTSCPDARILYIAIKPSLMRWKLYPQMRTANEQIAAYCAERPWLQFVDIAAPMLDPQTQQPRGELFVEDGLHLSLEGYALWTEQVKPQLDAAQPVN